MQKFTLKQIKETKPAGFLASTACYVWTHCGDGELFRVSGIDRDWWLDTFEGPRFSDTPQGVLYMFETDAERDEFTAEMRQRLAGFRADI